MFSSMYFHHLLFRVFFSTLISTSATSVPDVFVGDVSLATKAHWTLPLRPCNAGSAAGRLGSLGRSHDIQRYTSCCCMLQIIAMDLIYDLMNSTDSMGLGFCMLLCGLFLHFLLLSHISSHILARMLDECYLGRGSS